MKDMDELELVLVQEKLSFLYSCLEVKLMDSFSLRTAKGLLCLTTMSGPFMVTAKADRRNTEMLVD